MSAKSQYLYEDAGMLDCYGEGYDEFDDDCSDCPQSLDCETLSGLKKGAKKEKRYVAKMPRVKVRTVEKEEREEASQWVHPQQVQAPQHWNTQQQNMPHPQYSNIQYMTPVPPTPMQPYTQPGMQSSAQIIPHPAPHLTYMVSNPIDCPMPAVDESWYVRVGKNVLSGVLSEGGRQLYEYFRRYRF